MTEIFSENRSRDMRALFDTLCFSLGSSPGSRRIALRALLPISLTLVGCGGGPEAKAPVDPRTFHDTEVKLEKCAVDDAGAEKLDANGDGKAEIVVVSSGGKPSCRVSDLNLDGRPDRTVYFDEAGGMRRIESDYDRDGRVDEISLYKAGALSERHRATTLSGKLDTWEYYEAGKIVKTERDGNGDGYVDQWWEYPTQECPMIHSDTDSDGRPEPATTIDYCKATGYVPPPPQDSKSSNPTFTSTSEAIENAPVREMSNVSESEAKTKDGGGK